MLEGIRMKKPEGMQCPDISSHDATIQNDEEIMDEAAGAYFSKILTLTCLSIGMVVIIRFLVNEYLLVWKKLQRMEESNNQSSGAAYAPASGSSQNGTNNLGTRAVETGEGTSVRYTFTMSELIEYRIDYYFSTSPYAKPLVLLSATFVLNVIGAFLLTMVDNEETISSAAWTAWTYLADPGTHADSRNDFLIRVVSFSISVGGMLVFALMIGIISEAIGEKVDGFKKGRSRVIECGHTLMLGWSDKSFPILQQLALANESEGGGTIVVLAEKDKEELEEALRRAVENGEHSLKLLGTEVIFRNGNPLSSHELRRVSLEQAKSVIALSTKDDPDEADSTMVRQVLALKECRTYMDSQCHVVVELQDVDNVGLIHQIAPDFAEVVVSHDIIGRLMLQCAREPGLAFVLDNMIGFEGSEFYFEEWPELVGKTFFEIICRFDDAVVVGVQDTNGTVWINPENSYTIADGDKVLVLAMDNDSYELNDGSYDLNVGPMPRDLVPVHGPETLLFCGWRRDMADMIHQLDEYVKKGSELWLFNMVPASERVELLKDKGNKEELKLQNLTIRNAVGNPIIRRDLLRLYAVDGKGNKTGVSVTLDTFDSILILSDVAEASLSQSIEDATGHTETSDSRSLASLLIIQDIQNTLYQQKKNAAKGFPVLPPCHPVSEILDTNTRSLLKVADCKGYVMSNQIISAVIAQIAEERSLNVVFSEIMTAEGCETYLRDISCYVDLRTENMMSFWDVALRARQVREIAIGYKPSDIDYSKAGHLMLNPPDKSIPRRWSHGDVIIVLSLEDEPIFEPTLDSKLLEKKPSFHKKSSFEGSADDDDASETDGNMRNKFKKTRSMVRRMKPGSAMTLWGETSFSASLGTLQTPFSRGGSLDEEPENFNE